MNDNGTNSLKDATIINAVAKYSSVVFSLLFSVLLARLITPEAYGTIAVVTVFTNFFMLFSDMGIGTAVIQNKGLTNEDENRIFTFTILLGILLGILFYIFCAFVLTKMYDEELYKQIGIVLSINLFFRTINMVPNANIMKKKLFKINAIRTILTTIIGYIIAVILALLGMSYYAILAQSLVSSILIFCWNIISTKLKIHIHDILSSVKKIWGYSIYQFGFSFVNYFSRNLDNLLTGYFFGEEALGYYDKAYKLMRYPVENFTNVITPSIQPILSEYQNDTKYVFKEYNKIVKLLAIVSVYIGSLCFCASEEIILIYYGKQWENAVIPFKYLASVMVFQMVGGLSGSIYQCLNKTKAMFWSGVIGSVITVLGIIVGILLGNIEMLALCYAIGFMINFIKSQMFLAYFCFAVKVKDLIKVYIPEVIIAMILIVVMNFVNIKDNLFISLLTKTIFGLITFFLMLWITKEYKYLLPLIPNKIRKYFLKMMEK